MNQAYVIIDMQNDFIDGALGTKEAQAVVPRIEAKIVASKKDTSVSTDLIFTQDTHGENYLDTQEGQKLPVPHCIKDTKGGNICRQLLPYTLFATILEKPTFGSTDLIAETAEYDRIVLMGVCTDICVISNAMLLKAFYPEKEICVDASCCAGVTPESHARALEAMKMCQIDIL
ncbi:amidase [Megasphaera sp. ASD88]|uniref:cysteine hydrolase family protein n=1 Tax=Megasphaera sp. ASD88 TaxID=2027407 RepID=UPI000BAB2C4C|nr:isochorismatase family cysteine hydrolase [Megasphaera sp. ASD88]PAV39848.1 amidase [Megasphaera sp. ASD88]